MPVTHEIVDVQTPDGAMATYLYRPDDDQPRPSVIVIQEIFGVNANIRAIAQRFAEEGYVAAAPDVFYRSGRLQEIPYADMQQAIGLMQSLTDDGVVSDLNAVMRYLQAYPHALQGRVGVTGYCFGGRASFLAATAVEGLSAAAVYYGGRIVGEGGPLTNAANISAPIIGLFGNDDQNPTPDDVAAIDAELTRLGKAHEFHAYDGAGHGFMCEDRGSWRAEAAADAWDKTLAFFANHLSA